MRNTQRPWTRAVAASGLALGMATLAPSPAGAADGTPAAPAVMSHAVTQKNLQFNPNQMTIGVGDTVTWTNHEVDGQTIHSVVQSGGSEINSPDIPPETSFTWTFTQAEEYHFVCRFHPDMFMTLDVVAAPAAKASKASKSKGASKNSSKNSSKSKGKTKKAPAPAPAPSHMDSASKSVPAPPPGPPDSTIPGVAGLPFTIERDQR